MTDYLSANPAIQRFVDRYGMSLEEDGLSRTAARLIALMAVRGGLFSFSELADLLKVSRGSISTNTRLLVKMGLIERMSRTGDRQDYFQMVPNPELRSLEYWLAKQSKKEKIVEDLLNDKDVPPDAKGRISEMLDFMRMTTNGARSLIGGFNDN